MRKVTTPAKVCSECGSTLIHEKYDEFCDHCKEKTDPDYYLDSTIFGDDGDTRHHKFCSWVCYVEWLRNPPFNKKTVNFITLPFLGGSSKNFEEELTLFLQSLQGSANNEA